MTKILILIIKFYKYFIEALKTQGFKKGFLLGLKRILKCHPVKTLGGSHGIDFVPETNQKDSKNG